MFAIKSGRKLSTVALIALALVFAAAAHARKKPAPPTTNPGEQRVTAYVDISKIVWPNPPAIARIKFVDLFTGEKIDPNLFTGKKNKGKQKWMDRLAGARPVQDIPTKDLPFQLIRTYGLAVDSKGLIYAADQAVGAVFIFNPETKAVELIGNGREASFKAISGLAIDDNDRLFVTDIGLHRVDVFAPGTHQAEAVLGGDILSKPSSIAIDTENRLIYVVDTDNDIVDVFDADSFRLMRKIGTPGKKHTLTAPGTFSLPVGVAVDGEGNVFVCDTFNDRVEIFDADGEFVRSFGKNGDGPGDFERPKGIAVDGDGHIWVADSTQERVKVFDQEGRLLIYFGAPGRLPGQFMGLNGITFDKKNNRVITSEQFPGRVQVFRYVTDAEAEQLKKERDSAEKTAAAPAQAKPAAQTASAAAKSSTPK